MREFFSSQFLWWLLKHIMRETSNTLKEIFFCVRKKKNSNNDLIKTCRVLWLKLKHQRTSMSIVNIFWIKKKKIEWRKCWLNFDCINFLRYVLFVWDKCWIKVFNVWVLFPGDDQCFICVSLHNTFCIDLQSNKFEFFINSTSNCC